MTGISSSPERPIDLDHAIDGLGRRTLRKLANRRCRDLEYRIKYVL